MAAEPLFFRDLALVLIAAVLGGALAWLTRQPLVVGYVVGGMAISPFTPGPSITDSRHFEVFAEIGVVMLMFSIGIEFSLRDLMRVRWVALVGGPLGTVLLIGLTMATGSVLGWPLQQGLVVGVVLSVASTMVLARVLLDRGELHTRHGRVLVGISLVEDLAVVVFLALMPALGVLAPDRLLLIARGLGVAALILVPFFLLAARIVPPILTRVARTRNEELFLLVALTVGLGAAAVTESVGLSVALGAFLAGLLINQSEFAHETLARMLPLRDLFGAFFFVTVGALIDPRRLLDNVPLLVTMVALVVVGKMVIRAGVVRLFGETSVDGAAHRRGAGPDRGVLLRARAGRTPGGLYRPGHLSGHPGDLAHHDLVERHARAARLAPHRRVPTRPPGRSTPHRRPEALEGHVILCGYGRVGSAVAEALETFGMPLRRDRDGSRHRARSADARHPELLR